jgi:hypothetical protein
MSSLYIWDGINIAHDRNSVRLHLLRGEEPYKLRWTSKVSPNYRVILGRSPVYWGPYAGYHALRSTARRYVYSESAPRWIKSVADVRRTLHFRAARYANPKHAFQWIKSAVNWTIKR